MRALPNTIDDVALYWFTRGQGGALPAREAAERDAWLAADPAHQAAFDALAATWEGIEPIGADPRILALRRAAEARRRASGTWRVRAMAAALALAVVAGGGGAFWALRPDPAVLASQAFTTGVGEKATIALSDGSVVTLGTDTRLRTQADPERRVLYLDRGQAFFEVAKRPGRPFVVHAGGRTVTALGTAFEVRVDGGFKVTLVEGKVKVKAETAAPPGPAAPPEREAPVKPRKPVPVALEEVIMVPGAQLVALDDQHWSVSRTDVTREIAWVKGQLVYVDEPLGAVAAEMNRYSDRKIIVRGPAAGILISGTFKAGDVEAFVRAVEAYKLVRVVSEAPSNVQLAAAK